MSRSLVPVLFIALFPLSLSGARAQPQHRHWGPGPPPAIQEPGFQGKIDFPFSSQYIWRGLELNHQSVFQPSIRFNDQGFEVEVTGNMDLTRSNDQRGKFTRWIYRAGFARRARDGEAAISYVYYDNEDVGHPKTQEAVLEVRWGYPFFFGTDVVWDFDGANGFYFNSYTGYFIDAGPLRIIPRIGIGFATKRYQKFYFGVREDTFLDFTASLAAELNVWGPLFLTARGDYYELAKKGLRRSEERVRQGENFWAEGAVSIRF